MILYPNFVVIQLMQILFSFAANKCNSNTNHIRQKIVLDASNSYNRMVTRSISKRSHIMPKEDEKATIATVISPVRRSPRLYSRR